jgi:hypothetical protein
MNGRLAARVPPSATLRLHFAPLIIYGLWYAAEHGRYLLAVKPPSSSALATMFCLSGSVWVGGTAGSIRHHFPRHHTGSRHVRSAVGELGLEGSASLNEAAPGCPLRLRFRL